MVVQTFSVTGNAIATAEIARVDASSSSCILVHSLVAWLTIALYGLEFHKQQYLPSLAPLNTVVCWALTKTDYGSNASSLQTTATKVSRGWVLDGQKRWVGKLHLF